MDADLSRYMLWNVDPVMLRIGGRAIRYYSAFFLLTLVVGYALFHWQMRRAGHGLYPTSRFALWMFIGIMLGGRLGHCLFYEPDYYLRNPLQILDLSRGGVSSHGAAVAMFLTVYLYARRFEYAFLEICDRVAMGCMAGGMWIRVGNFFNSEIVGREWYGPWAVRFQRYAALVQSQWESAHGRLGWQVQPLPRHPVQLYEALGDFLVFVVLWIVDRRYGEGRPRGLLAGVCGCLYFVMRFAVESFKEYLRFGDLSVDPMEHVIRTIPTTGLTLGQLLSIPFGLFCLWMVVRALLLREPAAKLSRFDVETAGE